MKQKAQIGVVDFGGQYAHLIAKRLRHLGCYSIILSPMADTERLDGLKGLVLSGGPASVTGPEAPQWNEGLLDAGIPILGLCYGHQLIALTLGGKVGLASKGEYGIAHLLTDGKSSILKGLSNKEQVWMSHFDSVLTVPSGFTLAGHTKDCPVAAMFSEERKIHSVQFHPEVTDTPCGNQMLSNFVDICGADKGWSLDTFLDEAVEEMKRQAAARNVLMFLSGGVDSTVAFAVLSKALGKGKILGLYIDNGFMRLEESETVKSMYDSLGWNVKYVDASDDFLAATSGITDPQKKREAVGEQFMDTREKTLDELNLDASDWLLGQGTLYPDVIESGGTDHADTIKTHHNRVQGVEDLIERGLVVEPLRDLYKDEVRTLGTQLDLPDTFVWRHPFPGPGLSINVLCSSSNSFSESLSETEKIREFCKKHGYEAWILPVRSVGVQGDQRTYGLPVAVRGAKNWKELERFSTDLTNTFPQVNRVVFLLSDNDPVCEIHEAYLTKERLDVVRDADFIMTAALKKYGLMREVFQHLTIALPLGKKDNESIVLRPVFSEDVMTARFATLPFELIEEVTEKIEKHPKVMDVFYDITNKPPATFGWE